MKVHGCSGRSPQNFDSDGEESNSSSAGSISVATSPQVGVATGHHQVPGTGATGEWYVSCQPALPATDPLAGLGHFGNLHHSGAATAY